MILKLEDICSLLLGKFMFSFKNNSVPSSFSRSILRTNQVHCYNTRSSNRFYIPFCFSNIRKFSIFYQGPVFFKLNAFICEAPSFFSFQSRVTRDQAQFERFQYILSNITATTKVGPDTNSHKFVPTAARFWPQR